MTSLTLYDQVVEAAAAIQTRTSLKPAVALILGWKVAGYIGADFFLLRFIGTPWKGVAPSAPRPVTVLPVPAH